MPQPIRLRTRYGDVVVEGTLEELTQDLQERRRVDNIADGTTEGDWWGPGTDYTDCAEDILANQQVEVIHSTVTP